ncbi:MAG: 50S ribosomal protein L2 [Kofleriaceae bacterium]
MPVKKYKPTSPGRRGMSSQDFTEITKSEPEKSLLAHKPASAGRNNYGRVTSRFRGGGHKQRYRIVDFKRKKTGVPATVVAIEYDPNRSARIALLQYADGEKAYILAPQRLAVGDTVISANTGDIKPGNALPLRYIPIGTEIHAVELKQGRGAQIGRSAGTRVTLMAKEGDWATLRMPSGEMRRVHIDCRATIGSVGNFEHANIEWGKAGRMRWRGIRPHNRGVSMNPVDHPMGGGEGRSSGGRHPCTPWGQKTKGLKTRHNKRTDQFIIRRRPSK